ncbi:MAG TPA: SDR family oxidoreductase, partial [Myxococcales bacterium]|nr:SDR family oxidoreductase [Myxococcales bacterium]
RSPSKGIALITGPTSGIGLDLAALFAADRHDLVLVSRSAGKLEQLGAELKQKHGVAVTVIALDLSEHDAPARLQAELERRQIAVDVLVNNAGYAQYGAFLETDADQERRMMQLNMVTLTELTKRLVPGMVKRGRGRVLNVASTAAFMPGPLMAVYYATKAYVLSLSEALSSGLQGTSVTVTALCPGPTRTGFQARAQMESSRLVKGKIMDSATVARVGYRGLMQGKPLVIPGFGNQVQAMAPRLLPRSAMPAIVKRAQERVHA